MAVHLSSRENLRSAPKPLCVCLRSDSSTVSQEQEDGNKATMSPDLKLTVNVYFKLSLVFVAKTSKRTETAASLFPMKVTDTLRKQRADSLVD